MRSGPTSGQHGAHKLAGAVLMKDTCNTARCTGLLIEEGVAAAVEARVGAEAWSALSADQKKEKVKVYRGDCWQHMRNIVLEHSTPPLERTLD